MKVLLLSVPGQSPYMPPIALEALASYLRAHGVAARSFDVSLELHHYLLSPRRLRFYLQNPLYRASVRLLLRLYRGRHGAFRDSLLPVAEHPDRYAAALEAIRSESGFKVKREEFSSAVETINGLLAYTTLHCFPNIVTLNPGFNRRSLLSPFKQFYREVLIPRVAADQPDLLGISVSFPQQQAAAWEMVATLRSRFPRLPVVVGGSFLCVLCNELFDTLPVEVPPGSAAGRRLAPYLAPFAVQGEGEGPLLKLCEAMAAAGDWREVPGLIFHDPRSGRIRLNAKESPLRGAALPDYTFTDFPLGTRYLAPFRIVPLMSSRGCYWNRCAFCDHAGTLDNRWREMPAGRIVAMVEALRQAQAAELVFFVDELMSPAMLRRISGHFLQAGGRTRFFTMMRFERAVVDLLDDAARAGFVFLAFGFESGCARVLSLMNKGYELDVARRIIDGCAKNRICALLFTMFGFPGETREDAQQTMAFLRENAEKITGFLPSIWALKMKSLIGRHPEQYGVVPGRGGIVAGDATSYTVREGLSTEEAGEMLTHLRTDPVLAGKRFASTRFKGIDALVIERILAAA